MDDLKHIVKLLEEQGKMISRIEKILSETKSEKSYIAKSKPVSIKLKKTSGERKSITDFLMELKDDKFFNQPQTVNEIVEKLAAMSYHYSGNSLTAPLQRAVRNRLLGRVQKDGKWAWVSR